MTQYKILIISSLFRVEASPEDIVIEGPNNMKVSIGITEQGNLFPGPTMQNFKFTLHEHSSMGWKPRKELGHCHS